MRAAQHHHYLEVKDLHVHYGPVCALEQVSFRVPCGRLVGLIGPNGAGKSTLLKALVGLTPGSTGSMRWREAPLERNNFEIAYLPQRADIDWDLPVTVRALVETGRYPHLGSWRRFGVQDHSAVEAALDAMQLNNVQHRQISALSGGQQQRCFIARALAQEAHVLLLDEPLAGLDQPSQDNLAELLRKLANTGHLIISSHHDLKTAPDLFDDIALLNRKLLAFGPAAETLSEENLARCYTR